MQASRLDAAVTKGLGPCWLAADECNVDIDAGNQTAAAANGSERKGEELPRTMSFVLFTHFPLSRRLMR